MANNQYINKVVYGNQVLLDLTSDTVEADKILRGYTAHKANGEPIVGTYEGGGEGYTINLTASSSELYGQDIVVSYEGQRVTTIQFSNDGTASITVQEEGAYNFAVSYGGLTYYCDVNVVSAIVTYNETIYYYPNGSTVTPINDVQIWISCADVRDRNYTTLAEVFADTQLLATLMASENAVNYLVRSKQFIKQTPLVPVMTSDTTPEGVAFADPENSSYPAYHAFAQDVTKTAVVQNNVGSTIGYEFTSPKNLKRLLYRGAWSNGTSFKVQGYKNSQWVDITSFVSTQPNQNERPTQAQEVTCNMAGVEKVRLYQNTKATSYTNFTYWELQFYSEEGLCDNQTAMEFIGANDYASDTLLADSDWNTAIQNSTYFESVDNVKAPVMTSNNTPSGVCFADSELNASYPPFKAFDGDDNSRWASVGGNTYPHYVGYRFPSSVRVHKAKIGYSTAGVSGVQHVTIKDFIIQGSVDGSSYTDLYNGTANDSTTPYSAEYNFNNNNDYTYYRLYATSTYASTNSCTCSTLQFYGRQNGGIQTWLRSAGITDKLYTTLSEVFADSATLSVLMANHDAVDYLVICKGWATEVCSNQSAMSYIGLNNYASNTLLADETWLSAIATSPYKESVLNFKTPAMTGYDTPSGKVYYTSFAGGNYTWRAFDNDLATNGLYVYGQGNGAVTYEFPTAQKIIVATVYINSSETNYHKYQTIKSSDDNTTFTTESDTKQAVVGGTNTFIITNGHTKKYWQMYGDTLQGGGSAYVTEVQFYGRTDV